MAKRRKRKYEFRPDRQSSGTLSKLYLTQSQRYSLLKWALYGAVLLVLSLLQDTLLCKMRIFGATTDLVPCAILLICIVQSIDSGSVFVLVASALYVFSGTAPGTYCIAYLTVLGVAAVIFRQAFLRKGFSAAMLCTSVVFAVYELAVFFTGFFMGLAPFDRIISFMITAVITFVTAPILYPIVVAIGKIGGESWKE